MADEVHTGVVIIGGGPSGATLALALGRRGVPAVIVDQGLEPLSGVRAGGVSTLIMMIMRQLGVEDKIRRRAPIPAGWPPTSVITTGLCDRLLDTRGARSRIEWRPSPSVRQNIQSYYLESVLREEIAEEPSITTLYGYHFDGELRQDEGGVTVVVSDESGSTKTIHAEFAVAADGANSLVRRALDISTEGYRGFMTRYTVDFIAPSLGQLHDLGNQNSYTVINEDLIGVFFHQDAGRRWTFQIEEVAPHVEPLLKDAEALIRLGVRGDVEIEWASVRRWRANAFYASRQRLDRVFLIGDAAHATPPGALGLQQGIADAADLSWKLAAVTQGWGGEALLDSFEAERLPLSRRLVREVDVRGPRRLDDYARHYGEDRDNAILEDTSRRDLGLISATLAAHGHVYRNSPVLPPVAGASTALLSASLFAEIGKQLPHRWLPDGRALIDALGPRLTLLHGVAHDPGWASDDGDVPLVTTICLSDSMMRGLLGRQIISPRDAILVRPDTHVAWIGSDIGDCSILGFALGRARERVAT